MFTRRTSVLFPLIAASLPLAVAAAAGLPQGLTDDPGVQVSPQQALEKARRLGPCF
jgi:hypothetical protein